MRKLVANVRGLINFISGKNLKEMEGSDRNDPTYENKNIAKKIKT